MPKRFTLRYRAKFHDDRSNFREDMPIFSFFQYGGFPPSWICDARVWTTHKGHLMVFITVQNLVGIDAVVLITCMVFYFASLTWQCLFTPQNLEFWGDSNETHAPIANPPNSSQLGGSSCHSPKLHPGPCSSVDVRLWTARLGWPQYISRCLRLTRNVITMFMVLLPWWGHSETSFGQCPLSERLAKQLSKKIPASFRLTGQPLGRKFA